MSPLSPAPVVMLSLALVLLSALSLTLVAQLRDQRIESARVRRDLSELRACLLDAAVAFDRLAYSTRNRDFARFARDLQEVARRGTRPVEELTPWQRLKRRFGLAWREPSFCPHPDERRYTSRCSGGDGCDVTACGDCGVSL